MKAKLDANNFVYSPELLKMLGILAARDKRNLDEALIYKRQLLVQKIVFWLLSLIFLSSFTNFKKKFILTPFINFSILLGVYCRVLLF